MGNSNDSGRERMEWLLDFVQEHIGELRAGELLDLRADAHALAERVPFRDADEVARFKPDADPTERRLLTAGGEDGGREQLASFQGPVREGLTLLEDRGFWQVPFFEEGEGGPGWLLLQADDGTVLRRYSAPISAKFLAAAADLIARWWPEIRRCAYEPCGRWFLPRHGNQRYHDSACSTTARQERYAERHERDYRAEYEKRVKREIGRGAKPKHRHDQEDDDG